MKFNNIKAKTTVKVFLLVIFLSVVNQLSAQHGWSVTPSDYANNGEVDGIVLLDGVEVTSGTLGAFVGDECRGYVDASYFPPGGRYVFILMCYSNSASGEMMNFKYYNDLDGVIYDVTETLEFVSDMKVGDAKDDPMEFNAITNEAPVVDSPIPDQSLDEHFGTTTIELSSVFSDPDADVLTYSATSSSGSVVSVSVSGTVLTITEVGLGTATVTVTADDGLASADDVFDVTVNNVNDAPIVVNPLADLSPNEGFGSTTVNLSPVFSDPDGDALTYTAVSSSTSVVTVSVSGATLTITEVDPGTSTITVTASDGSLTVDDDFVVTLNNVNDPPVVSSPIPDQDLDEHFSSTTIDITSVFTDPDGDELTLTPVSSDPTVVTAGISGFTLTLTEVGLGTSTITITASDGSLSTNDVFDVTVNNVNDAPVVDSPVPDQTKNEHFSSTTIDLSGTFTDPDGDAIIITAVSSNTSIVTVSVSGTTLTVVEVGNGVSTITLTGSDGTLSTDDDFTFTVTNVNDAPYVFAPIDDQSYNEHFSLETISLVGVFVDPDGDVLTLTPVSSNPGVVTVGISGTTLTITEVGLGNSTITVTANDGSLSTNDVFTVEVNNVNDAPELTNSVADQNLSEHFSSTTINLSTEFTDPDGDVLSLSPISSDTDVVTVSISGTLLTITEVGLGTATITVTASDGSLSADDQFDVTVTNVNDAPVVENPTPDQNYDEHFSSNDIDLSAVFTDPDGDALTLTPVSSNPAVVTVGISGAILTITEVGIGSSIITITASDGSLTNNDAFNVTVTNVNDAPEVSSAVPDQSVNEHFISTNINLAGVFSDPDGDALSLVALSSNTAIVTVGISGATLIVTEVGQLGTATITVTASDSEFSVDDQFLFTVNNINDAPVVTNPVADQDLDEHFGFKTLDLTGVFTDPDGDVLSLSVVSSNSGVVTAAISGTTLTITEVGIGNSVLTVTASDGALTVNDQFSVVVNNVNDPPFVSSSISNRSYDEGFSSATISLASVFSDPDGDVLSLSAVSSTSSVVTVSVTGTTLTIMEVGLGSSTITVTASDGFLSTDEEFIVSVDNVNDAPVVDNPVSDQTLDEHFSSSIIDLSGVFSDPDGDALTLTPVSSDPGVVSAGISGTTLTLTEVGLGVSTITVTASDGSLTANNAFQVTVNNVNDAPVVDNGVAARDLNEHFGSTTIDLSSVFSDPDGDVLTLIPVSSATAVVTVSIIGTELTITEHGLGISTITVTASDGDLSTSDEFTVTVSNVNDAPVVSSPVPDQLLDEHFISTTIDLSGVFTDPDGDALTYVPASSDPTVVTAGISGTTLTLTEVGLGTSTITVSASDGSLSTNDMFTVTVSNVNDAPVVSGPVADQSLDEHFTSTTLDIGNVFTDPDSDPLTLSAVSSNTSVVTVAVSGTTLTIFEVGLGSSTITLTASDGLLTADSQFSVTVNDINDAPIVSNSIVDQILAEHFGTSTIDLSGVFSDPDSDLLTLTSVSSNTGIVSVSVTGTTLTITEVGLGSAIVTVTASDGTLSVDDSFTVTVNNVNDAPLVINPLQNQTMEEHFTTKVIGLSSVFNDPDGDALILTAGTGDATVVSVVVSGTNLIITETGLGSTTITVTASDGSLSTDETFTVTVNNVNDAPVVDTPISSISKNEGFGTTIIDLTPVFSDPDGDPLTYSAVSSNSSVVTVSVSGATLTITEGTLGSSNITVTASDGSLSTDDQFVFAINNVNDQPEVVTPIGNRDYDEGFGSTTINLASVFSDPDGDVLAFSVTNSDAGVVTATITGSTLTISEVGLGSSDIVVTASDGSLSIDDSFTATVNNVNDAPEVDNPVPDQTLSEYFGTTTIDLSGVFSDPDGDVLTLNAISSNTGVVSVSVSGSTLTMNEAGLGMSTITVTASDGALTVNDQFMVTVNNVNDTPIVVGHISNRVYDEGFGSASISLAPVFNDPDGDVLSLTATSSDPAVVTVNINGSILTISEVGLGTSTITVNASDGSLSVDDQFLVTVNNVNDGPVVANPVPDMILNEHFGSTTVDLSDVFYDPDGDVLSLTPISSEPSVVTVSITGTTLTITEVGMGISNVSVTANDGMLTVYDAFTVTVNNVNDAPVVANSIVDRSLNEHFGSTTVNLTGVFDDPDGDVLTLTASSGDPTVVAVNISGTTLFVTEVGLGTSEITVTASDGSLSVDEQFNILVNNVNDPPVVSNQVADQSLYEHFSTTTIDMTGVFADPDGDVLTLIPVSSNPAVVTVSISGTILTLNETGLGSSTITVSASDGTLIVDDQFEVVVSNVNDAPYVLSGVADQSLDEHFATRTIDISGVFDDPDGDALTYSAVSSNVTVLTVAVTGSSLIITEVGMGASTITVTANDGALSADDQFIVTVNNVNDAPEVANPVSDRSISEHFISSTINLTGVFTDPDGDALTLSAVSSDENVITVIVSGAIITITETGLGSSTITVTATDGSLSVDDQFVITVNNVNDAPEVANPVSNENLNEHFGTTTIDLSGVFSDPDGDALILTSVSSNPTVFTTSISGTTLTITEAGLGISTITVTASDGSLSVDDQFTVRINNVNDAPVVVNPVANQNLNEYFATKAISLTNVFSDPDGDPFTLTAVSSATDVVTVVLSGTTLTISEVGLGSSTITVTANDGSLSVDEKFIVTVNNVNDQPSVLNAISDQVLDEHFSTMDINIGSVFSDKDGDALTFSALSSKTGVVTVSVSGTTLTITEVGLGISTITVTASDGSLSVDDQFTTTVNNVNDPPVIDNPLNDISRGEQFDSLTIDLTGLFSDPDGDALTITAESSNVGVATASVSGLILLVKEVSKGSATISVTANDGELNTIDQFVFTIDDINFPPEVVNELADIDTLEHFTSLGVDLSTLFHDIDGDTLLIIAVSSDTSVVEVNMVSADSLVISEIGLGTATITVHGGDGEFTAEDEFDVIVSNVNDAPFIIEAIADQELVENFGSVAFDLRTVFGDPDGDTLSYEVHVSNSAVVSAILSDTLLTISGIGVGSSDVEITASDTSLSISGTFEVDVRAEIALLAYYKESVLLDQDTIVICNEPGEFNISIKSGENWDYESLPGWIIFDTLNDTLLIVAYSENLTDIDRFTSFTIFDGQGHIIELTVKQSADCNPDGIKQEILADISIYPNPVNERLYVSIENIIGKKVKMEIIDASGKLLYLNDFAVEKSGIIEVDMRNYIQGLYFIRISDGSRIYIDKIVKE